MPVFEIFQGLSDDDREAILALGESRQFQAGDRLFRLGEKADKLYLLKTGSLALTLPMTVATSERDITIDEKGPGALVGWSSLVAPFKYTSGAQALTEVTATEFDASTLQRLLESRPAVSAIVMTNLARVVGARLTLWQAIAVRNVHRWANSQPHS